MLSSRLRQRIITRFQLLWDDALVSGDNVTMRGDDISLGGGWSLWGSLYWRDNSLHFRIAYHTKDRYQFESAADLVEAEVVFPSDMMRERTIPLWLAQRLIDSIESTLKTAQDDLVQMQSMGFSFNAGDHGSLVLLIEGTPCVTVNVSRFESRNISGLSQTGYTVSFKSLSPDDLGMEYDIMLDQPGLIGAVVQALGRYHDDDSDCYNELMIHIPPAIRERLILTEEPHA